MGGVRVVVGVGVGAVVVALRGPREAAWGAEGWRSWPGRAGAGFRPGAKAKRLGRAWELSILQTYGYLDSIRLSRLPL